jgi:hypothetical protein
MFDQKWPGTALEQAGARLSVSFENLLDFWRIADFKFIKPGSLFLPFSGVFSPR